MGEINECLVGDQFVYGHLLDAQNNRALTDIFAENRPGLLILIVRKNPLLRRLHHDLDVLVFGEDLLDVGGSERSPALPHAFVLTANTDKAGLLHGWLFKIKFTKM